MPQGVYYIRISVDGEPIPDANICGGNPKSDRCSHHVILSLKSANISLILALFL